MKNEGPVHSSRRPAPWKLTLALAIVYIAWGTTYLAIKDGVRTLPPGLFAGTRVSLAGLTVLAFLGLTGGTVRLSSRDALRAWMSGGLMFVGGNGLLTFAEKTVPSGTAAVLAATMPLWMALLEAAAPNGERMTRRGWLGLLLGLIGVVLLFSEQLIGQPTAVFRDLGPLLVLGSAAAWALGSILHHRSRSRAPHLTGAAYQMLFGGLSMAAVGLALGEGGQLTPACLTTEAISAFFYLLVVGSLVGFVAYNWLLGHVPAALAGTCSYVNPVVALLVGWLLAGETPSLVMLGGVVVILFGVALVQLGGVQAPRVGASVAASTSSSS
jgi:drug/metabolite transporter (DMT)-like permease